MNGTQYTTPQDACRVLADYIGVPVSTLAETNGNGHVRMTKGLPESRTAIAWVLRQHWRECRLPCQPSLHEVADVLGLNHVSVHCQTQYINKVLGQNPGMTAVLEWGRQHARHVVNTKGVRCGTIRTA